jgi:hypothetical protein
VSATSVSPRYPFRYLFVVVLVATLVGVPFAGGVAGASTTVGSQSPVRATPVLTEDQLVAWWEARSPRQICNRSSTVGGVWTCHESVPYEFRAGGGGFTPRQVIRLYLQEGAREGIGGDIAFMQSIVETAWFFYPDSGQVRPEDNNTGGLGAFDGGGNRPYQFPDLRTGIRAQMQHLRLYADPNTAPDGSNLGSPLAQDVDGRYPVRWRFVRSLMDAQGQSRFAGRVPMWEGFGNGMWATDPQYASKILTHLRQALTHNGYATDAATLDARRRGPMLPPARVLDTRNSSQGDLSAPVGRRQTVSTRVAGRGGVPADARAVALNITAVGPSQAGFLTVWPSGRARPEASSINFAAGEVVGNFVIAEVGANGRVDIYNHNGSTDVVFDVVGYFPAGAEYATLPPGRVLDTRNSSQGDLSAPVGRRQTVSTRVAGRGGVPADARAVALNITAVGPSQAGFLTVWPSGRARPEASSINFAAGEVVGNFVIAEVGANGRVDIYNHNGSTDVVFDVVGYFPAPTARPG